MLSYRLVYLASLITFTFGALTFGVLAVSYWRQRRSSGVFSLFTYACAAAFVANLLLQLPAQGEWQRSVAGALAAIGGLVIALAAHCVVEDESGRGVWRWMLAGLYAGALGVAGGLDAAWLLGAAAAVGLACQAARRRSPAGHRGRVRVILALMLGVAGANLAMPNPLVDIVPDYLLLAFFCVELYQRERLAFFDLLLKRGAFFLTGLAGITLAVALMARLIDESPEEWSRPWLWALAVTPFWLASPWIYGRLSAFIDRAWLGRAYTAEEAEREFAAATGGAATEEELLESARAALERIFQAPVEVGAAEPGGERRIVVGARADGVPFLSGDEQLLRALSRMLRMLEENVRIRRQQEQLRLLAARAELRALRAQINPHFLFNALNAIAGLIDAEPRRADETIEQLAQVFRYALNASEKEWATLEEELEFVTSYMLVEQARFGERLAVDVRAGEETRGLVVPTMCVQPLAENAIKHGTAKLERGGRVGIEARLEGGMLCVDVTNDGPPFAEAGHGKGHGLRNVQDRLRGYYGELASLNWSSGGGETRVSLRLPAAGRGVEQAC